MNEPERVADPWEQLHRQIAPALVQEARALARDDPDFEPVCFVLGADAALQPPFHEVLRMFDVDGSWQPGSTASFTLPQPLATELLTALDLPAEEWLPEPNLSPRLLPVITCTWGELRIRHESL